MIYLSNKRRAISADKNTKIEEPTRPERHEAPGPDEPKQQQPLKTDKEIEEANKKKQDRKSEPEKDII